MSEVIYTRKVSDPDVLGRLLDRSGFAALPANGQPILLKPNLVEALAPPITTEVKLVAWLVTAIRKLLPGCRLLIGEGTGAVEYDTWHCFRKLGYVELAEEMEVELVDLNTLPSVVYRDPSCRRWPEMHLPALLGEVFLFSVPVLKAHSLAKVTLTMKNMMGCPPPAVYRRGNSWGKSSFHRGMQEAIFDLNRYRRPDFTLLDARVGMAQAHLWGPHCDPPVGQLVVSSDPVAIDSYGCQLLQRRWQDVEHISQAHGLLGMAEGYDLVEL